MNLDFGWFTHKRADTQISVHEFLGSTMLAAEPGGGEIHNHRFAGVTSEVKPI